jgi:hypothetical protein
MPDIQLNAQSITTTSATTAPSAGTSEAWTVTALASGIPTLGVGQTYALIDATVGASTAQQAEVVRVTAATAGGTSITVTRGADGTTPVAHAATSTFNIVIVQAAWNTMQSGAPSYGPEVLSNRYDNTRGVYNYKSSNTRILDQGVSDVMAGGISHHLWIGDSVSAGGTSGVGVTTFDRLRAVPLAFRDQLGIIGVPANGTGFIRFNDNNTNDARISANTGFVNTSAFAFYDAATNGANFTVTLDRGGTVLDVVYYDAGTATFTVSIDGATSGSNFATVTTAASANVYKKVRISGISAKIGSTVKFTVTTVGTGLILAGMSVWTPNSGIVMHNVSQSGSTAAGTGTGAWVDTAAGPLLAFKDAVAGRKRTITDAVTTAGSNVLTSATAAFTTNDQGDPIYQFPDSTGALFPPNTYMVTRTAATTMVMSNNALVSATGKTLQLGTDPDCVHIALGGNDLKNSVTPDTIATAITTIRNLYPASDCILHLENEMSTTLVSSANEIAFQQRMYQLADTLDVPLYDWRDRAGTFATAYANGVMQDNQAHMTPGMYADLGASLAWIVGGGSGNPQYWKDPITQGDLTNRRFVENAYKPFTAPSNFWQAPANQMGGGSATAVTSGQLSFVPFDVGPVTKTYSNIGVGVGTAQVGGTTTTTVGVYPDDGTGAYPFTLRGPTFSGTLTLTATGNRTASLSSLALAPGRYWLAFIYVASVAPSTVPTVNTLNNAVNMPISTGLTIGSATSRGWFVASQTVIPAAGTDIRASLGSASGSQAVVVALQAA